MNPRAFAIHVLVSLVIGSLFAAFTPAKWLAAALWVSAAMFINGSLAQVEDALPGGFDNPDGIAASSISKGGGASWFALKSVAIAIALAAAGCCIQFRS